MADKIVVLENGVAQQIGTPLELYNRPANIFVAGFIGSPKMNLFEVELARSEAGRVVLESPDFGRIEIDHHGDLPAAGSRLTLGLRPQALSLANGAGELQGEVQLVEQLGDQSIVELRSSKGSRFMAVLPPEAELDMGQRIGLSFDSGKALLFGSDERRLAERVLTQA